MTIIFRGDSNAIPRLFLELVLIVLDIDTHRNSIVCMLRTVTNVFRYKKMTGGIYAYGPSGQASAIRCESKVTQT